MGLTEAQLERVPTELNHFDRLFPCAGKARVEMRCGASDETCNPARGREKTVKVIQFGRNSL